LRGGGGGKYHRLVGGRVGVGVGLALAWPPLSPDFAWVGCEGRCPPGIYPHLAASVSVEESVDLKAHDVGGAVYPGLRGLKAPLPGAS
jgi:hypothetical protein